MPEADDVGALTREVVRLKEAGDYQAATPIAVRAVHLAEKVLGTDHPIVAITLNNLAALYRAQSCYADAEALYLRSLALQVKALGPDDPEVGSILNNLARLYDAQGRYAEAEPLYKRSLAILTKAFGPAHPSVSLTLNNFAGLYEEQGRYADAEPLYKLSLAFRVKALGPVHPDVGMSLNSLAGLYFAQRRYADAEPLFKHSIEIFEKALGLGHINVGHGLNNLAALYREQGRYADAELLLKRALLIRKKSLGPESTEVGTTLANLAGVFEKQGRYVDAELHYKLSLSLRERVLGLNHRVVAQTLNNLAGLYCAQGRLTEAEPLFRRAIEIWDKALNPNYPDVGTSLINLANLYRAQGRYSDAEALYRRVGSIPGWDVAEIPILFATNRKPEIIATWTSFGAAQESDVAKISFGAAFVRAPKSEVLNKADRFAKALGQRDRVLGRQTSVADLSIRAVELDAGGATMISGVRDRLARAARFPGQAFVFVHGYNNSFEDAIRRTAMIAYDLDFDGAAILFTWPSHAKFTGYGADRKRARIAAPFLVELFDRLGAELPDVKLHVLAHSTGGEIALSALTAIANRAPGAGRPNFGELILAHADVDPTRLGRTMPSLKQLNMGVTSYSSGIDWAMRISRAVRLLTRSRVGAAPVHIQGVDAIDITGLSGGPLELNHTVFVDNPLVFGDMNRLMGTGERPPDKRTALFVPVKTRHGTHWIYRST